MFDSYTSSLCHRILMIDLFRVSSNCSKYSSPHPSIHPVNHSAHQRMLIEWGTWSDCKIEERVKAGEIQFTVFTFHVIPSCCISWSEWFPIFREVLKIVSFAKCLTFAKVSTHVYNLVLIFKNYYCTDSLYKCYKFIGLYHL